MIQKLRSTRTYGSALLCDINCLTSKICNTTAHYINIQVLPELCVRPSFCLSQHRRAPVRLVFLSILMKIGECRLSFGEAIGKEMDMVSPSYPLEQHQTQAGTGRRLKYCVSTQRLYFTHFIFSRLDPLRHSFS